MGHGGHNGTGRYLTVERLDAVARGMVPQLDLSDPESCRALLRLFRASTFEAAGVEKDRHRHPIPKGTRKAVTATAKDMIVTYAVQRRAYLAHGSLRRQLSEEGRRLTRAAYPNTPC